MAMSSPDPAPPDLAGEISASGLEPHPHRFMLRGHPGSLAFPPLCAYCGAAASRKLGYAKAFTRGYSDDTPSSHVVSPVQVPFCDPCLQRHEAGALPRSVTTNLLASLTHSDSMGAIALTVAAAFATLNRDRLWTPGSPEVRAEERASNRRLWKFGIGLVIVVIVMQLLSGLFGD
jgi:hypothetical protein